LVDAALVYVAVEWVGPMLVSAVLTLGSSPNGRYVLFMIAWPLIVATSLAVGHALGVSPSANPQYRTRLMFTGRPYFY
jgi:hypothetical protein